MQVKLDLFTTDIEQYREALNAWGWKAQLFQLSEECAELIVEASKSYREDVWSKQSFIEEMCDVQIMLNQFKVMLYDRGHYSSYEKVYRRKMKKLQLYLESKVKA